MITDPDERAKAIRDYIVTDAAVSILIDLFGGAGCGSVFDFTADAFPAGKKITDHVAERYAYQELWPGEISDEVDGLNCHEARVATAEAHLIAAAVMAALARNHEEVLERALERLEGARSELAGDAVVA